MSAPRDPETSRSDRAEPPLGAVPSGEAQGDLGELLPAGGGGEKWVFTVQGVDGGSPGGAHSAPLPMWSVDTLPAGPSRPPPPGFCLLTEPFQVCSNVEQTYRDDTPVPLHTHSHPLYQHPGPGGTFVTTDELTHRPHPEPTGSIRDPACWCRCCGSGHVCSDM